MTAQQLIAELEKEPPDSAVLVYLLDGRDAGAVKEIQSTRPIATGPGLFLNAKAVW